MKKETFESLFDTLNRYYDKEDVKLMEGILFAYNGAVQSRLTEEFDFAHTGGGCVSLFIKKTDGRWIGIHNIGEGITVSTIPFESMDMFDEQWYLATDGYYDGKTPVAIANNILDDKVSYSMSKDQSQRDEWIKEYYTNDTNYPSLKTKLMAYLGDEIQDKARLLEIIVEITCDNWDIKSDAIKYWNSLEKEEKKMWLSE